MRSRYSYISGVLAVDHNTHKCGKSLEEGSAHTVDVMNIFQGVHAHVEFNESRVTTTIRFVTFVGLS